MALDGFEFPFGYNCGGDFAQWLRGLAERQRGENPSPGRVPSTFELAFAEGRVAGRLSVRHALNAALLQKGGHVGYGVQTVVLNVVA
jgi:predicted acetyltransferase